MCCVRVITGERYLLNKRLKFVEEDLDDIHFVKINNQTIINTRYITAFSATDHARIKVDLSDSSSYFVSRFYIKNFREIIMMMQLRMSFFKYSPLLHSG